jgi:hypothetical protein
LNVLSAIGDNHYQAHQQMSFVMTSSTNQQFRLRHLQYVLVLELKNALLFLPLIHQPAADRAFQL